MKSKITGIGISKHDFKDTLIVTLYRSPAPYRKSTEKGYTNNKTYRNVRIGSPTHKRCLELLHAI